MSFVHTETVRFGDLDSLGHMNNAVYATLLEQGRIAFLSRFDAQVTNMILARLEVDFRAQVSFGDVVEIEVVPGKVGTKSFELAYTMRVRGDVVAEAKSVLVSYDYESERPVEVPNAWREALAA